MDQALTEAKTHINEAENDDGVDNAKTKGINVINTIQLEIIKVEAKHEIDQSATVKKKIIDQTPDATEEEKSSKTKSR